MSKIEFVEIDDEGKPIGPSKQFEIQGDQVYIDYLRVTFDDWMWLLSEDRLLNRAYMKRWGVDIGDVIIFFEKP